MPRGVSLEEMLDDFRKEISVSTKVSLSVNQDPRFRRLLARTQRILYAKADWPHKNVKVNKLLQAGERYYDFPAEIDPEKTIKIWYRWGTQWEQLFRGIEVSDYSSFDSDNGARTDPAQKWEMLDQGNGVVQYEIWPVPASNGVANGNACLRIEGIRKLKPLVSNSDRCEIDSDIIILFAAAEELARKDKQNAAALLSAANTALQAAKGGLTGRQPVPVGEGVGYRGPYYRRSRILVAKSGN